MLAMILKGPAGMPLVISSALFAGDKEQKYLRTKTAICNLNASDKSLPKPYKTFLGFMKNVYA